MASDIEFVDYVVDQIASAGRISYRKMFGEYTLYCDGKVIALVCDNQLYIKPTAAGRAMIDDPVEAPPYPGAKPYYLMRDRLDDREWISSLVRVTAQALPSPKPKETKLPKRA